MPASAVVSSASGLDSIAVSGKFFLIENGASGAGESHVSWPKAQVLERYESTGMEPSWAKCLVPLNTEDDKAPAVAGVQGGPGDTIKVGARAVIKEYAAGGQPVTVLVGRVADVVPDFLSDTLLVTVKDARWDLEGFPIIGSFWTVNGTICYRQGERGTTNRDGMPNCLFNGGLPFMCYSSYGLNDGKKVPDVGDKNESLGTYWSCVTAMDHFRWIAIYGGALALEKGFKEACKLDEDHIDWPDDYTSALVTTKSPEERKHPEWPMFGNNMNALMSEVLRHSDFALATEPAVVAGKTVCRIKIVQTRYTGGGTSLLRPAGGNADPDFEHLNIVNKGNLRNSGLNTYTCIIGTGSRVAIEVRVDTKTGNLVWGWGGQNEIRQAKDDLLKWMNMSHVDPDTGNTVKTYPPEECQAFLFSKRPRLFSTAFISPTYDFQGGTTEAAFPRAEMTRPILPHILTTILTDAQSATQQGQIAQKRPIPIEIWFPNDSPTDSDTTPSTSTDTSSGYVEPPPTSDKPPAANGEDDEEYDYNGGAIPPSTLEGATIGLNPSYVRRQNNLAPGWDPATGKPPSDE